MHGLAYASSHGPNGKNGHELGPNKGQEKEQIGLFSHPHAHTEVSKTNLKGIC